MYSERVRLYEGRGQAQKRIAEHFYVAKRETPGFPLTRRRFGGKGGGSPSFKAKEFGFERKPLQESNE